MLLLLLGVIFICVAIYFYLPTEEELQESENLQEKYLSFLEEINNYVEEETKKKPKNKAIKRKGKKK